MSIVDNATETLKSVLHATKWNTENKTKTIRTGEWDWTNRIQLQCIRKWQISTLLRSWMDSKTLTQSHVKRRVRFFRLEYITNWNWICFVNPVFNIDMLATVGWVGALWISREISIESAWLAWHYLYLCASSISFRIPRIGLKSFQFPFLKFSFSLLSEKCQNGKLHHSPFKSSMHTTM